MDTLELYIETFCELEDYGYEMSPEIEDQYLELLEALYEEMTSIERAAADEFISEFDELLNYGELY